MKGILLWMEESCLNLFLNRSDILGTERERKTDRQTDRQRKTDRQTETERERELKLELENFILQGL